MVNLFDLISNKVGNVGDKVGSFYKNLTTPNAPTLPVIQLADNGEIDYQKSFDETQKQPRGMWEHLTGRTITMDADSTDPETGEITTQRIAKFQPGFFNNLVSGAKENFATGFAAPNLTNNTGEFGKKSASYRIGEGIGTLGRFLESPLGRGLLIGGIVGASGGSGLEALGYGAGTTMGNQGNRMRDRAYREQLEGMGIDTSNIRGYITDDVYRNMIDSQIAQENAAYRRMYYDNQAKQNELLGNLKNEQFEYQKEQDKIKNAQEWAKLENDKNKKNAGRIMPAASATNLSGTQQGIQQMETLMGQIPKYAKLGLAGPVGSLRRFNPYDANAQAFQQYVNTYKQVIGKGLEGGVLRKEDEAKYEKIIPRMGDTEEVLMRKAQQLQQMLINKYNTDLEALYNAGYDTGNFNYWGNEQQPKDSLGIL